MLPGREPLLGSVPPHGFRPCRGAGCFAARTCLRFTKIDGKYLANRHTDYIIKRTASQSMKRVAGCHGQAAGAAGKRVRQPGNPSADTEGISGRAARPCRRREPRGTPRLSRRFACPRRGAPALRNVRRIPAFAQAPITILEQRQYIKKILRAVAR